MLATPLSHSGKHGREPAILTTASCGDELLPSVRGKASGALLEAAKGVEALRNEAARKIGLKLVKQLDERTFAACCSVTERQLTARLVDKDT